MTRTVIISGARTPIGKLSGAFASLSAIDLAEVAMKAALERSSVAPDGVDYIVMGQVLQTGLGQMPGRQAAVRAGISMDVPTTMTNKMCLSGIHAVHLADLMIRAGEAEVVLAGGMESMTGAPYFLPGARQGFRLGDQKVIDSIMTDGLECALEHRSMGASVEADLKGAFSRVEQDDFALSSHERSAEATESGRLAEEIVPVSVPQRKGDPIVVRNDEGIRKDTSAESLSKLKATFATDGSVTAGNASQISNGAAALLVTTLERAEQLGVTPLCEIVGYGQVAGPDASLLTQPARAIRKALSQANLDLSDVDVFEINEAFAAVALSSISELGIDSKVVNVNGGAIALGHPIGMSGARLVLSLAFELARRGGGLGAAGLCGGGGQGDAILLRAIA